MPIPTIAVDGFDVAVEVAGPDKGAAVVLLPAAQQAPAAYAGLCERLHTASLKTVIVGPDPRVAANTVVGVLDELDIGWALLVGDRFGAELAWELAATRLDRFTGLVVIDRGHPRVADLAGVIRNENCPPVELSTTALVSTNAAETVAKATQQFVYGDYRIVELLGRRHDVDSTAQLAAEIVMRSSSW